MMTEEELIEKIRDYYDFDKKDLSRLVISGVNYSFLQIREKLYELGAILEEYSDDGVFIFSMKSGFLNMKNVLMTIQIKDSNLNILAYALEGLINQHSCDKAFKRLKEVL